MAVPDTSSLSKHQPRFTPSPECHLPTPETLTEQQTATLDAFRTHIHTNVTKTDAERRWTDDPCLIRFLKARRWNLEGAITGLQDTLQWRESYKPMVPDKESLWTELTPGKMFVSGFDKTSRPLLYMKPRLENTTASPNQIRHVVFHLEVAIALMSKGVQSLCIIIDFEDVSMTKSPGAGIAREILNVLGSHYPERLGKGYIIHAPWFFWPFYKMISPFMDPVTRDKINFVDMKKQKHSHKSIASTPSSASASDIDVSTSKDKNDKHHRHDKDKKTLKVTDPNLLEIIPDDMLEEAFGGTMDFEYNQEIYWEKACKVLADARYYLEHGSAPDAESTIVA
ncbi:hypothetical protein BGX26_012099 [Mortierella sp. AD094]|nr:hypothetical protein BGX26_012099 [Mortierella sp. AD094]